MTYVQFGQVLCCEEVQLGHLRRSDGHGPDPTGKRTNADEAIARVLGDLQQMLDEGQDVRIMLVATGELLSPREAGEVLGFSRQHVRRLIDTGELDGTQLPGSEHWRVSAASVESLLARRAVAAAQADTHARELDALGAPLE